MKKILTMAAIALAFFSGCSDDSNDKSTADSGCESVYCKDGELVQPGIGVRAGTGKTVITVDGYQFKDSNGNGLLDAYEDWRISVSERADDLVSRMTLNEKAGFINAPGLSGSVTSDGIPEDHADYIAITTLHRRYGLIRLSSGPTQTATFANNLQEICEGALREDGTAGLGIPYVMSADPLHGSNNNSTSNLSLWPHQMGFGAVNDPKVTRNFAEIAREELKANGIRMSLSPMADVASDPRWGRNSATFGSVPDNVAAQTVEYIKGFQGGDKLSPGGVICAVKHFPGHGADWQGYDAHYRLGQDIVVSEKNFNAHLKPFKKAFSEANVAACMPCYGKYPNLPYEQVAAGFNEDIMTILGRDEMGFEGFYTADWGLYGVSGGSIYGVEGLNQVQRLGKSIEAGMDHLGAHGTIDDIIASVVDGYLSEEALDRACKNVVKTYFTIGIFEDPYVDASAALNICNSSVNEAAGLDAMHKSLVLIKNSDATVPIETTSKIYFYGNLKTTDATGQDLVSSFGATPVNAPELADYAIFRLAPPSMPAYPGGGFMFYPSSRSLSYIDLEPDTEYGATGSTYTDPFGTVFYNVQVASNISELERIQNAYIAIQDAGANTKIIVFINSSATIVNDFIDYVDAIFYSFGCTDTAMLDMVFSKDGLSPTGTLPFEIPASNAAVEASSEEICNDTVSPSFLAGTGLSY